MTRWTELPPRPAVLVEALEELSRCVEGTSPGADLARTCRRVHSGPSPEGLNRPDRDLDPDLHWVSAGRTAKRYLPAPLSAASPKRRGDLRCARGTEVPNLGSGTPTGLGLCEMDRGYRGPDAPSFCGPDARAQEFSVLALHDRSLVLRGGGDFPGDVI
ncbi:hypothetical protein NN561_019304 [Cricetulus griseus]